MAVEGTDLGQRIVEYFLLNRDKNSVSVPNERPRYNKLSQFQNFPTIFNIFKIVLKLVPFTLSFE